MKIKLTLFSIIGIVFIPFYSTTLYAQTLAPINTVELSRILSTEYGNDFAFSTLIDQSGLVLYDEYYGFSDAQNTTPVTEKTVFNIASISKSVTAIGILNLVEDGKLNLSDTLDRFFDELPPDKKNITIHQLLSHSSGFDQVYILDGIKEKNQALKLLFDQDLTFEPGNGFSYSNLNFQLLAMIIEEISGLTYEQYIDNVILKPVGLDDTLFWDQKSNSHHIAHIPEDISSQQGFRNWGWIGGAGLYSSSKDLHAFWNSINNGSILSEPNELKLFGSYYTTSSGTEIGYGFYSRTNATTNSKEIWTSGSESWGHNAVIRHYPEHELTIIVLSNSGELGDARSTGNRLISDRIIDFLFEE